MNDPLEQALRLQLAHIDVWMEQGQQISIAPIVLRALRDIATKALASPSAGARREESI